MNKEIITVTATSYRTFEETMKTPHRRKCIDGRITGCGNCVGYCQYNEHPGYLTKELRKAHNCIKKSCNYYLPKEKPIVQTNPFSVLLLVM